MKLTAKASNALRPIVFIDDAHTFGGAQIALAWAIRAILLSTNRSIICVCTARTAKAIMDVAGDSSRLTFISCPPALPMNIVSFPVRIVPHLRIIYRLRRQGVVAWWLNLPGIEFCLAPLLALRIFREQYSSWLHTTEALHVLARGRSGVKLILNRARDLAADRLLFRLHPTLITPSNAASQLVGRRTGNKSVVPHLYPPVMRTASAPVTNKSRDCQQGPKLWMIGRIDFGHKNNLAAVDAFRLLRIRRGTVSLTVVGDGPDMDELRRNSHDLQANDGLTLLGWSADPWSGVGPDDVVVIPSFDETICLVAIEAMLLGIRLATSPLPAFYEGIPHQCIANGFSGEALANQVERVLQISRAELLELYSHCLMKFSAERFLEAFDSFTQSGVAAGIATEVRMA